MVKVKREQFVAPVRKEIDKLSAFQQAADAQIEHLCHTVACQARIKLAIPLKPSLSMCLTFIVTILFMAKSTRNTGSSIFSSTMPGFGKRH